MNAKLLDSQLRKLTDEEIEARDGKETDYSGFQFIEDSGDLHMGQKNPIFLQERQQVQIVILKLFPDDEGRKYLSPLYLVYASQEIYSRETPCA